MAESILPTTPDVAPPMGYLKYCTISVLRTTSVLQIRQAISKGAMYKALSKKIENWAIAYRWKALNKEL